MSSDRKKILKTLNPGKIFIPAAISLGFLVYMLFTDDNFSSEKLLRIVDGNIWLLAVAVLLLAAREIAYIFRLKYLGEGEISWQGSAYVILLWEFASAVTPSVVGGTPVAIFLMMKEGINPGKSVAFAIITAIFDNLYLIVFCPFFVFLYSDWIFPEDPSVELVFLRIFYLSYTLVLFYTMVMFLALFYKPRLFKWVLLKITSLWFLRRWKYAANNYGNEIIMASGTLRDKSLSYWGRAAMTTFFSWTARFLMLNILIMAYVQIDIREHFVAYGKHISLWVLMLASPTPGSSFAAEYGFMRFFEEMLGNFTGIITMLWRAISYYPFLLAGVVVLPRWINRVYIKSKRT